MEWISTKDKLPKCSGDYLAISGRFYRAKRKTGRIFLMYFNSRTGQWECGVNYNITHWMPLPAMPKEG